LEASRTPKRAGLFRGQALEISYVSGEEVQELVKGFYALPESVIAQARKIMSAQ
jgi:hypothetical protein